MKASRGMGAIAPSKMPKGRTTVKRDGNEPVGLFKKGGWIKGAIKHPGAFTKKAKAAGKSVAAYAKEKAGASGTLGKQARLAQTLSKLRKK
jgi:hypothetical protein